MIENDSISALDIELSVANHFNPRVNIIVPNISWGMNTHECDLLVLTKAGYATEIEIKISKADLIADKKKKHQHKSSKISRLYFAIPHYLLKICEEHIPEDAGIITVMNNGRMNIIRKAVKRNDYKFNSDEKLNLVRLGAMRIWPLKRILRDAYNKKYKKKHIALKKQHMCLDL